MGNNEILREIERVVRFNESVLRHNTVRLEKNITFKDTKKASQTAETESMAETTKEIENNDEFNETIES
jgi:ribosomal protein S6